MPLEAEDQRLAEDADRKKNWKRWGPYLSERQWGTVREDYSGDGSCWEYFSHDQARSRAYRWGEDGLFGFSDRECRLCTSIALWNGKDPILKERLYGLTNAEGNHGEDVKECYYYLEASPTYSYTHALYKYPQSAFPYTSLVEGNRSRGRSDAEFELADTGVFDNGRYFDVAAEVAKAGPDDVLMRISISNRGPEASTLHVLPTLWFRNTWSWGLDYEEGLWEKPGLEADGDGRVVTRHSTLGEHVWSLQPAPGSKKGPPLLFTENETNVGKVFGKSDGQAHTKDAFHEYVVAGRRDAVNPEKRGTKAAAHYILDIPAGKTVVLRLRLSSKKIASQKSFAPFARDFDTTFEERKRETDAFYAARVGEAWRGEQGHVLRQAYAGLLFTKQFYYYVVKDWIDGDPAQPSPPAGRKAGRNKGWPHLFNRDVISMPDKWEYPWYAAWDLAFHMLPFARIDVDFAKQQLILLLREWYMHPNGQIPAYEFAFGDVNPPVHAWACWRVYKMSGPRGSRDRQFLVRCFHKLLLNFTWWINRKDLDGNNLFSGGFLGLDNIGIFDRSKPLPTGGHLKQADGTAWMAFYCSTLLSISFELSRQDSSYQDIASKFFEHFVAIADACNTLGGTGLWDEQDGFYYDQLQIGDKSIPLRVRSLVGLIPLIAVDVLEDDILDKMPEFKKRMNWFLENRRDLAHHISYMEQRGGSAKRLLAIPSRDRLERVLRYMLDEKEFLSPHGIRSLSKYHCDRPYVFHAEGEAYSVAYNPGESDSGLFGGNSNWRGPIWFPLNYLLIEALDRYHHFYGDDLKVECPTGSGKFMNLHEVALEIASRLGSIFMPDADGHRPCHGGDERYAKDPHWKNLVLFHEYFHGESGAGLGANHQTGWTALVTRCIEKVNSPG